MIVRRKRTKLLWERETRYRNDLVERFRIEDMYYTEIEVEKRKNLEKGDFEKRLTRARQDLDHARDDVYGVEYDFVGFRNERQAVSPRAVRQGFTDALDQNVKEYREKVTATKHDCIFRQKWHFVSSKKKEIELHLNIEMLSKT